MRVKRKTFTVIDYEDAELTKLALIGTVLCQMLASERERAFLWLRQKFHADWPQ